MHHDLALRALVFGAVALAGAGCSGGGNAVVDGGVPPDSSSGAAAETGGPSSGSCKRSPALSDAGVGVMACSVANAVVKCTGPGGGGCECTSDDPTGCVAGCSQDSGATCQNQCGIGQYAVSCGGSPVGASTYQAPPDACVPVGGAEGLGFFCCPCE